MADKEKPEKYDPRGPDQYSGTVAGALLNVLSRNRVVLTGTASPKPVETFRINPSQNNVDSSTSNTVKSEP